MPRTKPLLTVRQKIITLTAMAKRLADEDEDEPKVRKRRYKPRKKEDDDDAPDPPRRGAAVEEDEDEEESISTGYTILDITLDFRDDCIEWSQAHILYAIVIGILLFLTITTLSFLFINSWVRYFNRPSLEMVIKTFDQGLFPETKLLADYALEYISTQEPINRAPFLFLQGATYCEIAERVVPVIDRKDYYLMAANYLKESAVYGFLPERADEGWFYLGKSLYYSGELVMCRAPLQRALEEGRRLEKNLYYSKETYWYLLNAYMLGTEPDLNRAREYLNLFQKEPRILEEELAESYLLETILDLQTDTIDNAQRTFDQVPHFESFAVLRYFTGGLIEYYRAKELRQQAVELETDPNPGRLLQTPAAIAPVPANDAEGMIPNPIPTGESLQNSVPAAPLSVSPMNDSALQELMRPFEAPTAVLGTWDSNSEIHQQLADMRDRYAQNRAGNSTDDANRDRVIVLPKEADEADSDSPPAPPEILTGILTGDPVIRQAVKYRTEAADHYQKAITLFTEAARQADVADPWGRAARLLTGICYTDMGESQPEVSQKANEYYLSLIEAFPDSPEAAAASFLIGSREYMIGNTDAAFRSFAWTLDNLRRHPNYTSFWLPKETILDRYQEIVRRGIETQNFSQSEKLIGMLKGVMPPAECARLAGETYERWAEQLQSQAETTFGVKGDQLAQEAEKKRRSAGNAFSVRAQLLSDTPEFSELLWRSAENYRQGKDFRRSAIEYHHYLKANRVDRRPEVHLRLGEMYLHLAWLDDAAGFLEEGLLEFSTHNLAPQLRLVLSYVYSEQGNRKKARDLLKINLIGSESPAAVVYRDSIYELGKLSFELGDMDSAIPYLEDALKIHPDSIQAADAHYTLAQSYLRRADERLSELAGNPSESAVQAVNALVQTIRQRAIVHLEQTEYILTERQRALGLTESERLMLRNAHFTICSLMIRMEQYEPVILKLNALATMYQDKQEVLDALLQMSYAQQMLGKDAESQTTLRRAEVILRQLEKTGTIPDGTEWRNKIQSQKR